MWTYSNEQKTLEISGIKIGGFPGQRPVVLVGSIFYAGQKIINDDSKGDFDRVAAENLINRQDEFSDKTGIPCMIDVVGSTSEALSKYLDFVSEITDAPLLLDGTTDSVRIGALEHVKQVGLVERIVYNSITPNYRKWELEEIRRNGIRSAIVLAYYMKEFTGKGRVKAVMELLPKLLEFGVDGILIDTCVLDVLSLGSACEAILKLKNYTGYPTGCAGHNAISTWGGLRKKMGMQAVKPCMVGSVIMPISVGADFILYGPIEAADYIFPPSAMVDAALAQIAIEESKKPVENHPIFKIA